MVMSLTSPEEVNRGKPLTSVKIQLLTNVFNKHRPKQKHPQWNKRSERVPSLYINQTEVVPLYFLLDIRVSLEWSHKAITRSHSQSKCTPQTSVTFTLIEKLQLNSAAFISILLRCGFAVRKSYQYNHQNWRAEYRMTSNSVNKATFSSTGSAAVGENKEGHFHFLQTTPHADVLLFAFLNDSILQIKGILMPSDFA